MLQISDLLYGHLETIRKKRRRLGVSVWITWKNGWDNVDIPIQPWRLIWINLCWRWYESFWFFIVLWSWMDVHNLKMNMMEQSYNFSWKNTQIVFNFFCYACIWENIFLTIYRKSLVRRNLVSLITGWISTNCIIYSGKNMIRKNLMFCQFIEVDSGNSAEIFSRWRRFYLKQVITYLFKLALHLFVVFLDSRPTNNLETINIWKCKYFKNYPFWTECPHTMLPSFLIMSRKKN